MILHIDTPEMYLNGYTRKPRGGLVGGHVTWQMKVTGEKRGQVTTASQEFSICLILDFSWPQKPVSFILLFFLSSFSVLERPAL